MSNTRKITAASLGLVLLVAAVWVVMPHKSHEIVIKPSAAVQR
jgi:hypothetical protein